MNWAKRGVTEARQKYAEASFAYSEAVARAVLAAERPNDATSDLEAAAAKFNAARCPAILTPRQRVRHEEDCMGTGSSVKPEGSGLREAGSPGRTPLCTSVG